MKEQRIRRTNRFKAQAEAALSLKNNKQLIQLGACLAILVIAYLMKISFPSEVKAFVNDHISKGMSVIEIFNSISDGINDAFSWAPYPTETPSASPEASASTSPEVSVSPTASPSASEIPKLENTGQASNSEKLSQKEPIQTLAVIDYSDLNSIGSVYMDELFIFSDPEEDVDDTTEKPISEIIPEKADYTNYTISFPYQNPVKGTVSSEYGYRVHPIDNVTRFHYALDIAANKGVKVSSFADGKVLITGKNSSYGNYILIEHKNGFQTLYAHLSAISVKTNQVVKKGKTIGKVGMTGKATGPHLHFEIRYNGKYLNPALYVKL